MKPVLLCLHGWGGSKHSFDELRTALGNAQIEILTPDLPGFGDEAEPTTAWTIDDYADWVKQYISQKINTDTSAMMKNSDTQDSRLMTHDSAQSFMLLAHSHGGRIAIRLANRGTVPIDHLYLCAAAGIRHPRHIKRIIGLTLAKSGKFLLSIPGMRALQPLGKKLLYKLVRVHDYEKASPVMQQTLINVTREDLTSEVSSITIPTDIFWGKNDGMTPYSDAIIMNTLIKNSILHSYDGVRHAVHRDRAKEIAEIIRSQLTA